MNAERTRTAALVFALACSAFILWKPCETHVRAAGLLLRFSDASARGGYVVREENVTVAGAHRPLHARIYTPSGVRNPPGIVIAHGVHRLGMDEPRLVRFAKAIASAGVVVLTPDIDELRDYRVDPASIDTIGIAARTLRERLGQPKVGVMGLSFAGGLSLLAAADAHYANEIGFVVAVGAHDDLERVSAFFATNTIPEVDGRSHAMQSHPYGPIVVVYSHVEDFFPTTDVVIARDALRLWLWEDRDAARTRAEALSPFSKEKMKALFDGRIDVVAPEILREIDRRRDVMGKVSPHGHIGNLRTPVYLLHGAGDSVIPSTETLWLAHDLPISTVRNVLVSSALVHVELEKKPSAREQLDLVHFMAEVLEQADADR